MHNESNIYSLLYLKKNQLQTDVGQPDVDPWLVEATLIGRCGELMGNVTTPVIDGVATFDIAVKGVCPAA